MIVFCPQAQTTQEHIKFSFTGCWTHDHHQPQEFCRRPKLVWVEYLPMVVEWQETVL
jgi:hypothetical protein